MSKTFTIDDLNNAYETLKNIDCPYDYDTHRDSTNNVLVGIDLAERKDRSVVIQTAFHRGDIYEILGMNEIKTDCKYYSGEHLLFCAVNTKCDNCVDYCPE